MAVSQAVRDSETAHSQRLDEAANTDGRSESA